MNPLFAALQETYASDGDVPVENTSTIRGLMAFARRWLTATVEISELTVCLQTMLNRIENAARETRADLDSAQDLDPGLQGPLEHSYEGYLAIADALREMLGGLAAKDRRLFEQGLDLMEEAATEMSEAQREIKLWMHGSEPRCPRCGIDDESQRCTGCTLDFLVPDPEAILNPSARTGVLRQEYLDVYAAYQAVLSGEAGLGALMGALSGLERMLGQFLSLAGQLQQIPQGEAIGSALIASLQESVAGIERMRQVTQSRHMVDLNAGWAQIFDSALHLQSLVPELARTAGQDDAAAAVETDLGATDSISITGD